MSIKIKIEKKLPASVKVRLSIRCMPTLTFYTNSNKAKRIIKNHAKHFAKLLRMYLMANNHQQKYCKIFFRENACGNLEVTASYQYPDLLGIEPILPAVQSWVRKGGW